MQINISKTYIKIVIKSKCNGNIRSDQTYYCPGLTYTSPAKTGEGPGGRVSYLKILGEGGGSL